jgi:uncharacterized protein
MTDPMTPDFARIAQDLQIRKVQVESVVQLLDEGNTVPFITRYRKERTGGLNEEVIRRIEARVQQMRQLAERKQTILKSIENQGKLTDELRDAIVAAESPKRLEDLYLPYKPKKRSLATAAREKGLEPLALAVWGRDPAIGNLDEMCQTLVNPEKELPTIAEVKLGVQHILAEMVAETADIRAMARMILWDTGRICTTKSDTLKEGEGLDYKDYFEFTEPVRHLPPHRILAINRGEKEGPLKVRLEFDGDLVRRALYDGVGDRPALFPLHDHPHAEFMTTVAEDALNRLLLPSIEREIRRELTEHAQDHAVAVFARNLRSLLLQPPLRGKRVLALDPGFRTGCKAAALDETGNLIDQAVIFPHPPQNRKAEAKYKVAEMIGRHQLSVVAIGNGTACRETEEIVSEVIANFATIASTPPPPRPPKPPKGDKGASKAAPAEAKTETPPDGAPAPETAIAAEAPPETSAAGPPTETPPAAAETPPIPEVAPVPAPAVEQSTPAPAAAEAVPTPVPETPPVVEQAPPAPPPEPIPPPPADLAYIVVNEAGASVYSASPVGREEFPDFDATLRGTISIGRRLQDPLSELVKIDPQNIGVGLYQHDVNPKHLKESLESVIESCVNYVGVDLNTASVPLLRHVSGLNALAARELVDFRKDKGPFKNREQLKDVPNIGPTRWVQAAGFLKVIDGEDPLDRTWIHPESYAVARQILQELGYEPNVLSDAQKTSELQSKLKALTPSEVSARLQVGEPTVCDILEALGRPGRDPREDLPPPIFKKGILQLEDLQPGMELKGTVLNVVDFGAFIDIGLKDSGLVHISQMANRYIKNPYDVVAVGDVVTVWVLNVDKDRRRVSLTMIQPGSERKPPERKAPEARPPRSERPPHRTDQPPRGAPQPRTGQRPPPVVRPAPKVTPPPAPVSAETPAQEGTDAPRRAIAITPPRPPRPQRQPPKPKLTQSALEGRSALRTFNELAAFFEAKEVPEKKAEEPKPETPEAPAPLAEAPTAETPAPPAEAPAAETPAPPVEAPKEKESEPAAPPV